MSSITEVICDMAGINITISVKSEIFRNVYLEIYVLYHDGSTAIVDFLKKNRAVAFN